MNLHCDEKILFDNNENQKQILCCEMYETEEKRAYADPILLDDRVLNNILLLEDRYAVTPSLIRSKQTEVRAEMRKIVSEWMMEVCEEQECQGEVFLLAMNYMDRFLMQCNIKKNQLQLLGTTCMLIASKFREPRPLAVETLVYYTDHSVKKEEIWSWEVLVLSTLKWDIAAITPHDFLSHLLNRLPVESVGLSNEKVNKDAKTTIALCAREFQFSSYLPSIIACASVASALNGMGWTTKSKRELKDLLEDLHIITNIEMEFVEQCLREIEQMILVSSNSNNEGCDSKELLESESETYKETMRPEDFTPPPKSAKHETAVTPTDVHDVRF